MKVRVGKYDIPVRGANAPTLWYFSSGAHGKKEAGPFAFWTAVLRKKRAGKNMAVWGRALVGLSAGDRFDRMKREMREAKKKETRAAYRRHWQMMSAGKGILYIRPSTSKEVGKWMSGHESDAKFAKRISYKSNWFMSLLGK